MAPKLPVRKIDEADCPDLPGDSRTQLLEPLNRNLDVLSLALDAGLTLANQRVLVKTVQVIGPDEWVPLTLAPNWAAGLDTSAPSPAYRYSVDGLWTELRGAVRWTGGGSPASGTLVATRLPTATGRWRHVVDSATGYGRVDSFGDGTLTYVTGGAADLSLAGARYEVANPSLPAWAKPLDVVLGEVNKPPMGRPEDVRILYVEREDKQLPGPVSIEGWVAGPVSADKRSTVRFKRINGLAQGVKYRITFLFQLPD